MSFRVGSTHTGRPVFAHPKIAQLQCLQDDDLFDAYLIYAYLRHGFPTATRFETAARWCVRSLQGRGVYLSLLDEGGIRTVDDLLNAAYPLVTQALRWSDGTSFPLGKAINQN